MANNILSTDYSSEKAYQHSGFSSSITDSFSTPSYAPYGIGWDGSNLLSTDSYIGKFIYKHSGFSSTITDSFQDFESTPNSVDWDGTDLMGEKSNNINLNKRKDDKSNINSIKHQCKKANADILIQGVISVKEIGDILNHKRSTSISVQLYNKSGEKIGEAQYITSKSLSSAMRLKGIAAKIVSSMEKLK